MSTPQPVPPLRIAQVWYVPVAGSFGFIGELTCIHEEAAAFVVHAVAGQNLSTAKQLLGQVIVVPQWNNLWEFLSGPR